MLRKFFDSIISALFSNKPFFGMTIFTVVGAFDQYAENPYWWLWLSSLAIFIFYQDSYTWKMDFPDESILWSVILIFGAFLAAPYVAVTWFFVGIIRRYIRKRKNNQ